MKKTFLKLLSLLISIVIIFTTCIIINEKAKVDFDVESQEYLIRFTLTGPMLYDRYCFILTPDNRILAAYANEYKKTKKAEIQLDERQRIYMKEYINQVLTLKEDDITGFVKYSDAWTCIVEYKNVKAYFDYGVCESVAINILLEQIIGCCDSEKELKTKELLHPETTRMRNSLN